MLVSLIIKNLYVIYEQCFQKTAIDNLSFSNTITVKESANSYT